MDGTTKSAEGVAASSSFEESLRPQENRILGSTSYLLMWIGGCIAIAVFTAGSSLIGLLNLTQAICAMALGTLVIAVALVINGRAGHKYGIPYTIHLRSCYGIKGAKVPGVIRALPAIVWFGFQSWVGAAALNAVFNTMFGFDNVVVCFILFNVLQVLGSLFGFKGIKWLENVGSAFILVALIYMFVSVVQKYGLQISESVINIEGSWGLAFWGGVVAFTGQYSTMILNISDYSRQYKKEGTDKGMGSIYWLAIGPSMMFMGLIGLIVTGATGVADPIHVFTSAIDNPVLLIFTLLFIVFAQITTNVLNNLVPPVYILMDACKKISYRQAVVIIVVLACCTFPWRLVTEQSAVGLALFIQTYAAFLGPVFAVMAVDYYIIRKQKLNIDLLYNEQGPIRGVNWAAIIATCIGAAVAVMEVRLSWFSSLFPAGISYYLLMRYTQLGSTFLIDTPYEKK